LAREDELAHREREAPEASLLAPERIGQLRTLGVDRRRRPGHLLVEPNAAEELEARQRPGLQARTAVTSIAEINEATNGRARRGTRSGSVIRRF